MATQRANILYIVTDQQRYDTLACNGNAKIRTPNLDRLAAEGVRFENAYTVCATCSPARASMLTGMYPHKHGMLNNQNVNQAFVRNLPPSVRLISQDLGDAGYACGYVGKWHVGSEKLPSHYGFTGMDVPGYGNPLETPEYGEYLKREGLSRPERRDGFGKYEGCQKVAGLLTGPPEATGPFFLADETIRMLRGLAEDRRETGRPFFLFSTMWAPHWPVFIPEPYASMYDPDDIDLPENFNDDFAGRTRMVERISRAWALTGLEGERDWKRLIALYWGFCSLVDDAVGKILNALETEGLADETLVLFTTDHGDMQGSHGGLYDKGMYMFEETYRIPMIARAPGGAKGQTCGKFVSNMDIATTALDAAGVSIPADHDGRSLLPLLTDPDDDWRDDIYCQFTGYRVLATMRMVRWSHYKFIFNAHDYDELYDLDKDPGELTNVISDPDYAAIAEEGRARIIRNAEESGEAIRFPIRRLMTTATERPGTC